MATIRDSIVAAAEAVKGESIQAGPTITDALDALADALAGENVDSAPLIADEFAIMAQYLSGGGGGAAIGEMVSVKTDGVVLTDFGFDLMLDGKFVANFWTDDAGVSVCAGATIVISSNGSATGTYKIGDGEAKPLEQVDSTLRFTIPVDTPAFTEIVVSGNF